MSKPNIFKIATKELSQDGFFTWFLQWADPSNRQYNAPLHECATGFVKLLVSKQIAISDSFEVNKVEADRQWENIDIWAKINDNILIIIEDKTFTKQHSKQLERYKETAQDWCSKQEKECQLVCLYLKTGSQSKSSLANVHNKGYAIINRTTLLTFFSQYQIANDIYNDFVDRIKSLEESENSFENQPIEKWRWGSWSGFYQFLEERINVTDWQYVPNPNGGFLGLWWHFLKWKEYSVYLQIEQGNLCLKIGEVKEKHGKVRKELYTIIMKQAKNEGRVEIQKPARFGSGICMTVAIVARENWLGADNAILDKEKVIQRLKEYEDFLDRCLKS